MDKKILGPGIFLYETNINEYGPILNNVKKTLSNKWHLAAGVNTENYENEISLARKCFDYAIDGSSLNSSDEDIKLLYLQTDGWINKYVQDYSNFYSVEKLSSGPYIYLKYEYSDKFDYHIDDGKKYPRTVSVSAYLNDDYDGGMIEFNHFGISHKPKSGDIIVFSSSFPYMHRVTPVDNGTRYAVVNWYRYSGYPMEMQ